MAAAMADELERNRLIVEKDKDGSRLRRVVSENPEWYRKLCAAHTSRRKDGIFWREHKTSIRRKCTLRALRTIAAGRRQPTRNFGAPLYVKWLRPIIRAELAAEKERLAAEKASVLADVPF